MGILKPNYARPGRGISPEEASQRSYFGILKRKSGKLVQVSLIYTLCNGVFFAAFLMTLMPLFYEADAAGAAAMAEYISDIFAGRAMLPLGFFVPFMLMGPGNAAITYITRNFSRQEHAFVWSDFWTQLRKNFRQSLSISVLTGLVYYLYFTALIYYANSGVNGLLTAAFGIYAGFIIFMVPLYAYTIMVTYDMKLWHILKNSCLISLANLPKSLMLAAILSLTHGVLMVCFLPIWITLLPLFLFGWSFYTISYISWEAVEKYMRKEE